MLLKTNLVFHIKVLNVYSNFRVLYSIIINQNEETTLDFFFISVVSTPLKSGKGVPQLTNYKDDISRPTTSNLSTDVIGSRNSSVLDSSSSSRYNFRPR